MRKTLQAELAKRDVRLPEHSFEDLVADGLLAAWRLSERHDQRRAPFAGVLRNRLKGTYVDFVRRTRGRTRWVFKDAVYERPARPVALSLDAPAVLSDQSGTLGETLADWSGDPAAICAADLSWLYVDAVREAERDIAVLREGFARRAGGRVVAP